MDIAYSISESYTDYCLVSLYSLFANNQNEPIRIHILCDNLSEKAKAKLTTFVHSQNGEIRYYIIPDEKIRDLALNGWTKYAWYRLFLPELLGTEIQTILYLDTDIIISGAIKELFELDLTAHSIAGCQDIMSFSDSIYSRLGYPKEFSYICSGVLLINLTYFRQNDLSSQIINFAKNNPDIIQFPDQDAINCVCHSSMKLLPLKFNILPPFFTNQTFINAHREEVKEMLHDPRIIHYAGCAPWIHESVPHYFESEFWKYASIIGGIRKKKLITGMALIKHRVKQILGIMQIPAYKRFNPKKAPDFSALYTEVIDINKPAIHKKQ